MVGQNRHDVLGFKHRADAVSDRLAAVGDDDFDRYAELIADEFEQFAQSHRLGARWSACALGPTGRSIRRCVEPAAIFFDMIEATICSRVSRLSGRSTEIRISSAGDRLTWPPQIRQPLHAATMAFISSTPTSTRASTSIVSAVPAGEVIAREDVFGIVSRGRDDRHHDHRGAVAGNAADAMLVDDDRVRPFQLRAGLRHRAGEGEQFVAGHEARRADQERCDLHVRVSIMRRVVDDGAYFRRARVYGRGSCARTASRLSGGEAGVTVTRIAGGLAKRRNAGSESPISSGAATRHRR